MGSDEKYLWKEVLESKYGSWRSLDFEVGVSFESNWLKDLRKTCRNGAKYNWFNNNISWDRGNASKILFWEYGWIDDIPLLEKYPRMYANSLVKKAKVEDITIWRKWEVRVEFGFKETLIRVGEHACGGVLSKFRAVCSS